MQENSTDETLKLVGKLSDWTLVCLFVIGFPINLFSLCLLLQKILSFYVFPNGCFRTIPSLCTIFNRVTCFGRSNDLASSGLHTSYMNDRQEAEFIRHSSTKGRRLRQKPSIIHRLLLLLCVSDLCVIIGLLASFSLPNIWLDFNEHWPYLAPWWIPMLQIALLTSVYTTVLISLERYVRIVYVCSFKHCWFFNKGNFRYYLILILTVPTMFFLPKFFELRLETKLISNQMNYNCTMYKYREMNSHITTSSSLTTVVPEGNSKSLKAIPESENEFNETDSACDEIIQLINNTSNGNIFESFTEKTENSSYSIKREEFLLLNGRLNISYEIVDQTAYVNILDLTNITVLDHTDMRKNSLYYNVYILGLTTTLTQIIPMAILLFFNFRIYFALKASRVMRRKLLSRNNYENRTTLPSKKLKQPEKDNLYSKEKLNQNDTIDKKNFESNKRPIESFSSWQRHLTLPIFLPSDERRFETHYGHRFCSHKINSNQRIRKSTRQIDDRKIYSNEEEPKRYSKKKPSDAYSISSVKSANDVDQSNSTCYTFNKREKCVTFERSKSLKAPYPLSHHPKITRVRLRTFNSTFHQTKGRNKWMDESDRNNTIERTLDNESVVKYEIPGSNMSKIRKAGLCYSKKTCCSKVFLKNEKSMTRASIMIVWLSIGCHIWRMVPNIYEAIYPNAGTGDHPIWLAYFSMASHVLIAFNSSVNFLIYLF